MSTWATRILIDYVIGWWGGDYDATRDDNERHDIGTSDSVQIGPLHWV